MDVPQEIFDLARSYLQKVRRSGAENIMAICPFHGGGQEKHQSFALSLTKGVYFCHACHAKGSLYTFLKEMGLTRESINMKYGLLIQEAGKNIPTSPDPKQPKDIWVDLASAIDESLLGLFQYNMTAMLPDFEPETLEHFGVGWDGWHRRIIFPVYDLKGSLVALSGRAVYDEQWPRYKLYEEEYRAWDMAPRYNWNKRTVLWNGHFVYPTVVMSRPTQSFVVVVEGFKAAMWVWQAGIRNVVALLGSYLSWEQQWVLERLGVPVYLFLDNNGAGWKGQIDAAMRLGSKGIRTYIVEYPERIYDEEDAQPDSLTEEEVRTQRARAPEYGKWVVTHHN
jgi:DNA primase